LGPGSEVGVVVFPFYVCIFEFEWLIHASGVLGHDRIRGSTVEG
jgi:hypothetical protein